MLEVVLREAHEGQQPSENPLVLVHNRGQVHLLTPVLHAGQPVDELVDGHLAHEVPVQELEEARDLPGLHADRLNLAHEEGVLEVELQLLVGEGPRAVGVRAREDVSDLAHGGVLGAQHVPHLKGRVLAGQRLRALHEDGRDYVHEAAHDDGDEDHVAHDEEAGDGRERLHERLPLLAARDGHEQAQHAAADRAVVGEEVRIQSGGPGVGLDSLDHEDRAEVDDEGEEQQHPEERHHAARDGGHQKPQCLHLVDASDQPGGVDEPQDPNASQSADVVDGEQRVGQLEYNDHSVKEVELHVGARPEQVALQVPAAAQLPREGQSEGDLDEARPVGRQLPLGRGV
mmetsp:Transcript_24169/g.75155  ORF Transcript_24169/g.75155 Transcript_24169/m.75155 type:complete len:343 (-) Transcript_24169:792-1820(-)